MVRTKAASLPFPEGEPTSQLHGMMGQGQVRSRSSLGKLVFLSGQTSCCAQLAGSRSRGDKNQVSERHRPGCLGNT